MNTNDQRIAFAIATADTFDDIHRLNYRGFVEEIPQHPPNPSKQLVDKFHDQNTYVIATCNNVTIGMVALRGQRPFSIDSKLDRLDRYLPESQSLCEIRLLYVVPEHRRSQVFYGLAQALFNQALHQGFDRAVVSATLREMRLYLHLGFVAFGPEVGSLEARYQPMWLDIARLKQAVPHLVKSNTAATNFSTGPVAMSGEVRAALAATAISHRSGEFKLMMASVAKQLCAMTSSGQVAVLCGSGTTANDIVATQILAKFGAKSKGLVLINGEFGERLLKQARRAGLDPESLRVNWGQEISPAQIAQQFATNHYQWIWSVHCETSTGALLQLDAIKLLCAKHQVALYLDCMSTIGTMEFNLTGVCLASGSSGKGLASVAGLAIVFVNDIVLPTPNAPACLDLSEQVTHVGPAFTLASNLLAPLATSLSEINSQRYHQIKRRVEHLRQSLIGIAQEFNFEIVTPDLSQSALITIALPRTMNSHSIGLQLSKKGFKLGFESAYLKSRNWLQFAMMGASQTDKDGIDELIMQLRTMLTQTAAMVVH
jgi:aspartate aminotransferase-like enzyme